MRHRQAVALAAVALVGLAGCNGPDPNNLETYYDDPTPTSSPVVPTSSATVSPAVATPTPTVAAPDYEALASSALLTDADVANEGVVRAGGESSGCLVGAVSVTSQTAIWKYPSGALLRHKVAAYADQSGAAVVAAVQCDGKTLAIQPQEGIERQLAWCEGATCTILLAKGSVVSALSVSASTETRAADAVKELLPVVAAKLRAQP